MSEDEREFRISAGSREDLPVRDVQARPVPGYGSEIIQW